MIKMIKLIQILIPLLLLQGCIMQQESTEELLIQRLVEMNEATQTIERVNFTQNWDDFCSINGYEWVADDTDYLKHPTQTMIDGCGDCEDLSLLSYYMVDAEFVQFVGLYTQDGKISHIITQYERFWVDDTKVIYNLNDYVGWRKVYGKYINNQAE